MKINGYDVLKSKRGWQMFCRKGYYDTWFLPEPERYPCIVESRIGSDEESYLEYIYLASVTKMRDALIQAGARGGFREVQLPLL